MSVSPDREAVRPRGFAFVEMANAIDPAEAIRALGTSDLDGREFRGREAQDTRGGGR